MSDLKQMQEDLNDLANVDDVEEDVSTTGELFFISSFGVDYPVETLVSRMEKKLFTYLRFNVLLFGLKTSAPVLLNLFFLGSQFPAFFCLRKPSPASIWSSTVNSASSRCSISSRA